MAVESRAVCFDEKYLSVKVLAECSSVLGDKGQIMTGVYSYLRWIDDQVDESDIRKQDKLSFLNRQKKIVSGQDLKKLLPEENNFRCLPWASLDTENKGTINQCIQNIIRTMKDDVMHQESFARNDVSMSHYRVGAMNSCLTIVGTLFNGREIGTSRNFDELLDAWSNLGYLLDFQEDIGRNMLQVNFSNFEVAEINSKNTSDERLALALRIFDKNRFDNEKKKSVATSEKLKWEFLDRDMPTWQKFACIAYSFRVLLQSVTEIKYPTKDVTGAILRRGLVSQTKRLIQNTE